MKRLLLIISFVLGLMSVAGQEVGPVHLDVPFLDTNVETTQTPRNARPSRRGGWICENGYVRRNGSCVTITDATDAEVRQQMIASSVESYSGSCPCPDFRDRGGRRCGGRSAYSRPGGASPLCYARDISDEAVSRYRRR